MKYVPIFMSRKPGKTIQRDCIFPFIVKYKGAAGDTSIYYDPWFDKSPPRPSYYLSTYLCEVSGSFTISVVEN